MWDRFQRLGIKVHLGILALAFGLAAVGVSLTGRLEVDTQLESLLPEDTPTMHALAELRARVSADSPLTLLVHSSDAEFNRRMQDHLAENLGEWQEARWVTTTRDLSALQQSSLLYLGTEALTDLTERTEERSRWEYCRRMPGCVNFDDEPPAAPTREALVAQIAATPSGQALEQTLGMPLSDWVARERDEGTRGGRLCTPDGEICAVQAVLNGRASSLSFARRMKLRAEALLDESRSLEGAPADLEMAVSGRYRSTPTMRDQMNDDLFWTALVSTVLMLLVLLAQFRDLRALALLLAPLAVGLTTTLGVIALIHPSMNLVSAFTLAVLAGIGIDFGIHIVTYFGELRGGSASAAEAVVKVFQKLLRSLLAAGITTGLAFAAVSASSFRGIAEMGWMAGVGIALSLLAYFVVFPSLSVVLDHLRPQRGSLLRTYAVRLPRPTTKQAGVVVAVGVLVAIGFGFIARDVEMERNFRNLRTRRVIAPIRAADALGGTNGASVYLLAENAEALRRASEDLVARRFDGLSDEGAVVFFAPGLLLPQEQEDKLELFGRMRTAIDRLMRRASDEERARLASLREWVARETPLTADDLPQSMRNSLTEDDGTFGTVAVMYPPMRGSDGVQMERLARITRDWNERYEGVRFASPHALLGEVLPALSNDAVMMIVLALLGLIVATGIFGRSVRRTVLVLLPVVVAITICGGLMVLFDLRINLYNTLVFPVAFGMGIDGAVYITWATIDAPDLESFMQRYRTSARAVVGSGVTSLCAFGSLSIAGNPGLASIGYLAVVAIAMTLVANLLWMPALIVLLRRFDAGSTPDADADADGPETDEDANPDADEANAVAG